MFKVSIPKISDEEMMKRYEQIKPVIKVNGKLHYFREYTLEELSNMSYFFNRNESVLPFVKAFEIIESPQTAADFRKDSFTSITFDNGYHVSTVRLYYCRKN